MSSLKDLYAKRMKLSKFPLISRIPQEYLWEIAENSEQIHLRKNTIVYSMLDQIDYGYFILKGQVEVVRKNPLRETECCVISNYQRKYNQNGIKIRSYHGVQQPNKTSKIITHGQSFGVQESWLSPNYQMSPAMLRNQMAQCRTSCILYKIPVLILKGFLKREKPTEPTNQVIVDKNFEFCKPLQLEVINNFCNRSNDKYKRNHKSADRKPAIRLSICKFNKNSNQPLGLVSEALSIEPTGNSTSQAGRHNKSSIDHYAENKKQQQQSFSMRLRPKVRPLDQNSLITAFLQARGRCRNRRISSFSEQVAVSIGFMPGRLPKTKVL